MDDDRADRPPIIVAERAARVQNASVLGKKRRDLLEDWFGAPRAHLLVGPRHRGQIVREVERKPADEKPVRPEELHVRSDGVRRERCNTPHLECAIGGRFGARGRRGRCDEIGEPREGVNPIEAVLEKALNGLTVIDRLWRKAGFDKLCLGSASEVEHGGIEGHRGYEQCQRHHGEPVCLGAMPIARFEPGRVGH